MFNIKTLNEISPVYKNVLSADKFTVDILECHRKSVDLRLDTVHGFRLVFAEPFVKFPQLVERKHVL